jgi:hypothetical protein
MIKASVHIVNPVQGLAKKFTANLPARPQQDDILRMCITVSGGPCGFNFRVNRTWFEASGDANFHLIVSATHESFFNPAVEPSAIVPAIV